MPQEIKVINLSDEAEFENILNAYLEEGWRIPSTSCGFLDSENYNFQTSFQAILAREVV